MALLVYEARYTNPQDIYSGTPPEGWCFDSLIMDWRHFLNKPPHTHKTMAQYGMLLTKEFIVNNYKMLSNYMCIDLISCGLRGLRVWRPVSYLISDVRSLDGWTFAHHYPLLLRLEKPPESYTRDEKFFHSAWYSKHSAREVSNVIIPWIEDYVVHLTVRPSRVNY